MGGEKLGFLGGGEGLLFGGEHCATLEGLEMQVGALRVGCPTLG